ncbi:MAG TPA: hypothetical protein VK890_09740 [Bacteroidia bacterium]|nr:hypothetical protein [Bacteroidia bacterium]
MNKMGFFLCLLFFTLLHSVNAQDKNVHISQPLTLTRTNLFQHSNNISYSSFLLSNNISQKLITPLPSNNFNYTLPKGAIFCRMEDALYKRFNIWIKFRMGTDDRYSN